MIENLEFLSQRKQQGVFVGVHFVGEALQRLGSRDGCLSKWRDKASQAKKRQSKVPCVSQEQSPNHNGQFRRGRREMQLQCRDYVTKKLLHEHSLARGFVS